MKTFAQIISIIFHPVFIPLYCTILFVSSQPFSLLYSINYKLFFVGTMAVFTCIIPLLYLLFQYLNGLIPDVYISDKTKRLPIYLLSLLCYAICAFTLKRMQVEIFFLLLFISSSLSVLVVSIINFKWKISAHGCGAGVLCGAVFAFAYYIFSNPVVLFCSVIMIAGAVVFSRLYLQAHTFWQAAAGFFVGLAFSVFPIFLI